MNTLELIKKHRFIAILRHIPAHTIEGVTRALHEGGIRIIEVTFNPSNPNTLEETKEIIQTIKRTYGNEISVGAGTVLNVEYARAAWEAGAEFIVSPCTKESVISFTKEHGMLSIPGAYTPTEIVTAYDLGADIVKVFPVAPNEVGYLKNVMSPLSHIPFIPTGGINPNTVEDFLNTGAVAVAAGATVVTKELAENGDWAIITANAKKHAELAAK